MDIYILYKSPYKQGETQTDLAIYQLKYDDEYFFQFYGECLSLNVEKIGGFKEIQLCQFKHGSEIKRGYEDFYVEVGE